MIPIAEIASVLDPAPKGRRYLAIYRFFCDESYDGNPNAPNAVPMANPNAGYVPATYIIAGFFAEEATWTEIERRFTRENERAGVRRYHAANVNGRSGEFEGWSKEKRDIYAKNLLDIVRDQGMDLHAVACGMLVRDYQEVINTHGREAFGPPHLACFKTLITTIAQEMASRNFEQADRFAVIFDHNDYDRDVVSAFLGMKYHPSYKFGARLATCDPGTWEEYVPLQAADLIAYESFKALHEVHRNGDVKARKSLESLFSSNGFMGSYLDRATLNLLKPQLENSTCEPNGFVLQLGLRDDRGFGIPLP